MGLVFFAGAVFMLIAAMFGSGDVWVGYLVALGAAFLGSGLVARGAVVVSPQGVGAALPWAKAIPWDQLVGLTYVSRSGLETDELLGVRRDGTRAGLAIVPSFPLTSQRRLDRSKRDVVRRIEDLGGLYGWQPSTSRPPAR